MRDRVLVVGESLVDIVVGADGVTSEHPGGSPMNVAIGLGRLGLDVELHTSIGADDRGERITEHLRDSGVRLEPTARNLAATSTATARIGVDGAATYEFAVSSELPAIALSPEVDLVHVGSIGAVLEPGASVVRSIVAGARGRASISYDPNIRPALMGDVSAARAAVESLVRASDIVKASDEDLHWLYPSVEPSETASRWALSGPAIVVVTHGADGAWGYSGLASVSVAGASVAVHDTIGAGDSFMAGLLAALSDRGLVGAENRQALAAIAEADLTSVIAFAIRCAAITVSRPGADPPTREDLRLPA